MRISSDLVGKTVLTQIRSQVHVGNGNALERCCAKLAPRANPNADTTMHRLQGDLVAPECTGHPRLKSMRPKETRQ